MLPGHHPTTEVVMNMNQLLALSLSLVSSSAFAERIDCYVDEPQNIPGYSGTFSPLETSGFNGSRSERKAALKEYFENAFIANSETDFSYDLETISPSALTLEGCVRVDLVDDRSFADDLAERGVRFIPNDDQIVINPAVSRS
jgi:hypothetical protein